MPDYENLTHLAKCAGCAAKLGAGSLAEVLGRLPKFKDENLLVGFDTSDDASIYKISDELALVQTIDFFPPIVDDAYMYGQIAAANAISDVYAMGGEPKLALNVMCIPKDMPKDVVYNIMKGGYDKAREAGVVIAGGHTIDDDEPKYGLTVTGFVNPKKIMTNSNSRIGDKLILTKPLGIGILTTSGKKGIKGKAFDEAMKLMATLNKYARDIMIKYNVHSCTDITGFGLCGHGSEMALGSGVTLEIDTKSVPIIDGALELAKQGYIPGGLRNNQNHSGRFVKSNPDLSIELKDILFDPQTSGGLLISVDSKDAEALAKELSEAENVPCGKIIGEVKEFSGDRIILK